MYQLKDDQNPVIFEDCWDQSQVFIGRTDAEAETPVLWPPHVKSWLIGKDPDAGRDWGQEEKGTTEDEMAGWHHWLYGYKFAHTLGVNVGQEGLACYDSWGRKELDTTEWLDWTELNWCCRSDSIESLWFQALCYTRISDHWMRGYQSVARDEAWLLGDSTVANFY